MDREQAAVDLTAARAARPPTQAMPGVVEPSSLLGGNQPALSLAYIWKATASRRWLSRQVASREWT